MSGKAPVRKEHAARLVFLIWLAFLCRGAFYATILPVWEGYDEWSHFAFVQYLVAQRRLPPPAGTRISRELEESLQLLPLPWTMRDVTFPHRTHDAYWRLSDGERDDLRLALGRLARRAHEPASEPIRLHEAQQAPFYYALASPLLGLCWEASLPARVFLLRYASVLLASVAIPIGFLIARRLLTHDGPALSVMALVASMPGFVMDVARVGNESLAVALYSGIVYFSLKVVAEPASRTAPWWLGVALGLGLLTKAYFLAALPGLGVILLWKWLSDPARRRDVVASGTIAAVLALSLSGWWYWRNRALTGSWSGDQYDVQLADSPPVEILRSARAVDWYAALDSAFVSHIWFGNWSFLTVRSWMYHVFRFVFVLAAAGLVLLFLRLRAGGESNPSKSHLIVLAAYYGCFCVALAYSVVITFAATGMSATTGWYIDCLVTAEALLLSLGLFEVFGRKRRPIVLAALTVTFVLLDLYATHMVLIPYYTGIIAHNANGALATLHVERLGQMGVPAILARLALNKPGFIDVGFLGVAWLLYVVATLGMTSVPLKRHESANRGITG